MQRFGLTSERFFSLVEPLTISSQLRFAAIEQFVALRDLALPCLPRSRDFLLSDFQFALHIAEPCPLSGSLTFPIGFLLFELNGIGSQLLSVFLTEFAKFRFQLLAMVLEFGERRLDVRVVSFAVTLNDGPIGVAARLERSSLFGELLFFFVEVGGPLHAELLPLGFPIQLQTPQRFVVLALQLLTVLFELSARRVQIRLLLPALFHPFGFGYADKDEKLRRMRRIKRSAKETVFAGVSQMQSASFPSVETGDCRAKYVARAEFKNSAIGAEQLCAGTDSGSSDSCTGDSGGPLAALDGESRRYQVGVVSWGAGCAEAGMYGIYTRVSAYAEWLRQQIEGFAPQTLAAATLVPANLADGPQARVVRAALGQLTEELRVAQHRVRLNLPTGPRARLGEQFSLDVQTDIGGRLIVVDVNADGVATQIFPNQFTRGDRIGAIAAGARLMVPPPVGSWGFLAFRAEPPLGKGRLIAMVVPESYPYTITVASPKSLTKGIGVVPPAPFFMNLVQEVVQTVAKTRTLPGGDQLKDWGLGILEYEIVP